MRKKKVLKWPTTINAWSKHTNFTYILKAIYNLTKMIWFHTHIHTSMQPAEQYAEANHGFGSSFKWFGIRASNQEPHPWIQCFNPNSCLQQLFIEPVKHLFLNCTDVLCCSFFCPRTCLNRLFSPVLALPFYPALPILLESVEEIHLVFLPLEVQKMDTDHHCKCTKG